METIALNILYGMPAIAGDANSAEQGLERIAFANEGNGAGWYLDETRPFMPQIAGLKGGGVWIDSQADDGRSLQNDSVGNVTETIYLILGGDLKTRYQYLSQLNRIADQARQFHTTHYQTRPVQLEWWAAGAPAPQWALVYDISVSVNRASYDLATAFEVVVTLEREPSWRGVMFGQPATVWTQYMRGVSPGAWDLTDLSLASGDALVQENITNHHEFAGATGYDYDDGVVSKNYIDIDADMIPGDAPALLSVAYDYALDPLEDSGDLYISRSTKPRYLIAREDGSKYPQFVNLNAGDAGISAGAKTTTADESQGVIGNGSNTQKYYWLQAASASTQTLEWGTFGALTGRYEILEQSFRGEVAVFVRGRTDSTSPASFTFNMRLSAATITLAPAFTPTAPASDDYIFYLGNFTIPLKERDRVSVEGLGVRASSIDLTTGAGDFSFQLSITTATATQTTRVIDVVLLPFDEGQIKIVCGSGPDETIVYDSTGYLSRNVNDSVSNINTNNGIRSTNEPYLIGNEITLIPKTDNRLYFMLTDALSGFRGAALDMSPAVVRINIIPRWYGVRDV